MQYPPFSGGAWPSTLPPLANTGLEPSGSLVGYGMAYSVNFLVRTSSSAILPPLGLPLQSQIQIFPCESIASECGLPAVGSLKSVHVPAFGSITPTALTPYSVT